MASLLGSEGADSAQGTVAGGGPGVQMAPSTAKAGNSTDVGAGNSDDVNGADGDVIDTTWRVIKD